MRIFVNACSDTNENSSNHKFIVIFPALKKFSEPKHVKWRARREKLRTLSSKHLRNGISILRSMRPPAARSHEGFSRRCGVSRHADTALASVAFEERAAGAGARDSPSGTSRGSLASGGRLRVIASIEAPPAIARILWSEAYGWRRASAATRSPLKRHSERRSRSMLASFTQRRELPT